jgi:hypothetical protein
MQQTRSTQKLLYGHWTRYYQYFMHASEILNGLWTTKLYGVVSVRSIERKSVKVCSNSLHQIMPGECNSATSLSNIITTSSVSQIKLDLFACKRNYFHFITLRTLVRRD